MINIAMLSGGQDSTAMTLRLLEIGEPVDIIAFCDTGLEHKAMYDYIDNLDAFFRRKYNKEILRLYPSKEFEEWVFGKCTKGENEGKIRGVPRIADLCYWRREAKEYPLTRWLKKQGINKYTKYVGYTSTETARAMNMDEHNYRAPLIEWGWNEIMCRNYLREMEMENPLYRHFGRTGCAICPKQRIDDYYNLYKHYPEVWAYMKDLEGRVTTARKKNGEASIYPAFHTKYFTDQLEEQFKKKDRQATFEFEHEPVRDCFCKI